VQPSIGTAAHADTSRGEAVRRFGLGFVLAYFVIYVFPFPIGTLPGTQRLGEAWDALWNAVIPWLGTHVLRLPTPITVLPNGSADTTFNWVQVLAYLALAGVVAFAAVAAGMTDERWARAAQLVRVYVRYGLASVLLFYGSLKLFQGQFPPPTAARLLEPYGQSSPMGLLWTFMGSSRAYSLFSGLAEMGSGLLLLWRRTVLLGSLCAAGVLLNIVALNFCYDVPVKLFSTNLLLMALFLVAPHAGRLADVFLRHRLFEARLEEPLPSSRRWPRAARAVKTGLVLLLVGTPLYQAIKTARAAPPPGTLTGAFEVERWDGAADERWQRVGIGSRRAFLSAIDQAGTMHRYWVKTDRANGQLILRELLNQIEPEAGPVVGALSISSPEPERVVLAGTFRGAPVSIHLRHLDERTAFPLLFRGFHWISEYPFNR